MIVARGRGMLMEKVVVKALIKSRRYVVNGLESVLVDVVSHVV